MRGLHTLALLASAYTSSACSVEVSVEGKDCPCIDGYDCVAGKCVERSSGAGFGPCLVGFEDFRADWATPHGIRWAWEPIGKEQDFQEYQLVTGTSEADVRAQSGSARVWTSVDNAELGVFMLRRTGTEDLVRETITDDLEFSTHYYGQLSIRDTAGCVAYSPNIAGKSTTDATPKHTIMGDVPVAGWGRLTFTTTGCYADSAGCWTGAAPCESGTSCYLNAQQTDLDAHLVDSQGGALAEGGFATAYLEFQFKNAATVQPWWGGVLVRFANTNVVWRVEPIIYRKQGEYRRIEVPLSAFVRDDTWGTENRVTATLTDTGGTIQEFTPGIHLMGRETVWLDEVQVGW